MKITITDILTPSGTCVSRLSFAWPDVVRVDRRRRIRSFFTRSVVHVAKNRERNVC